MKIARPEEKDLQAVWNLINILNTVSYELNPLKPINDDGDFEFLEDDDKAKVLDKIVELHESCDIQWLMTVLETLLSPDNKIIDQEAETLEFHPELKAALSCQTSTLKDAPQATHMDCKTALLEAEKGIFVRRKAWSKFTPTQYIKFIRHETEYYMHHVEDGEERMGDVYTPTTVDIIADDWEVYDPRNTKAGIAHQTTPSQNN